MVTLDAENRPCRTRYASLARPGALLVLCATLAAAIWCLRVVSTQPTGPLTPPADERQRDALLYRRVVERVHAGEGYYDAAGDELRSRSYPTRSFLNWRPPLYAWMNGRWLGPSGGQLLLSALVLATVLMAYRAMRAECGVAEAMATVVLVGLAIAICLRPEASPLAELWAGTAIALSVCAYALCWPGLGVAAGLFALFYRELALPYALVCLGLALRRGRRGEAWSWVVGLALFGVYLAFHALEVSRHQTAADLAHEGGWVRFGGTAFVLTTVGFHPLLAEFPPWTWAIYLPLSVLGLVGWRGEMGTRVALAAGAYLAAFAVVGLPFNNYWGLIDAPLLALGFVRAPASMRDLIVAVRAMEAADRPRPSYPGHASAPGPEAPRAC